MSERKLNTISRDWRNDPALLALLNGPSFKPFNYLWKKPKRGGKRIGAKKLKGGRVRFRDALRVLMGPAGWISLAVENHREKKAEQKKEQEEIDRKLDEKFGMKPADADSPPNDITTSLTVDLSKIPSQPKLPEPNSNLQDINDITLFEDPFDFDF